jgi:hypothetical protein
MDNGHHRAGGFARPGATINFPSPAKILLVPVDTAQSQHYIWGKLSFAEPVMAEKECRRKQHQRDDPAPVLYTKTSRDDDAEHRPNKR